MFGEFEHEASREVVAQCQIVTCSKNLVQLLKRGPIAENVQLRHAIAYRRRLQATAIGLSSCEAGAIGKIGRQSSMPMKSYRTGCGFAEDHCVRLKTLNSSSNLIDEFENALGMGEGRVGVSIHLHRTIHLPAV